MDITHSNRGIDMNTGASYISIDGTTTESRYKLNPSVASEDTEYPALKSLREEYNALVSTLKKQDSKDVALLMRLRVVMTDLGFVCPSAP